MDDLKITILGSGSSGGVPRFGGVDGRGDWGRCDPEEPKNRRSRCSILVQKSHPEFGFQHDKITNVLVDTSPDMRQQLLDAQCSRLDSVLYTHAHADQTHGLDDLRVFAIAQRQQIPVYIDDDTSGELLERFDYCFERRPGSWYPAILNKIDMPDYGTPFLLDGPSGKIQSSAFLQFHGGVNSLGFRFGDLAYSSDLVGMPPESFEHLSGIKTWIVDALQYEAHGSHAHLDLTLEWIAKIKPELSILTNLHVHMDYQTLIRELPEGVVPAFDGMTVAANSIVER